MFGLMIMTWILNIGPFKIETKCGHKCHHARGQGNNDTADLREQQFWRLMMLQMRSISYELRYGWQLARTIMPAMMQMGFDLQLILNVDNKALDDNFLPNMATVRSFFKVLLHYQ